MDDLRASYPVMASGLSVPGGGGQNDGVQEVESCRGKVGNEDRVRDRHTYVSSDGLEQRGVVEPVTATATATATTTDLPLAANTATYTTCDEKPAAAAPPRLNIVDDPFTNDAMMPDDGGGDGGGDVPHHLLTRGLQVPSRVSRIKFGFGFPEILAMQGIQKWQWNMFKRELKRFASLTLSQRLTALGMEVLVDHFLGFPIGL